MKQPQDSLTPSVLFARDWGTGSLSAGEERVFDDQVEVRPALEWSEYRLRLHRQQNRTQKRPTSLYGTTLLQRRAGGRASRTGGVEEDDAGLVGAEHTLTSGVERLRFGSIGVGGI